MDQKPLKLNTKNVGAQMSTSSLFRSPGIAPLLFTGSEAARYVADKSPNRSVEELVLWVNNLGSKLSRIDHNPGIDRHLNYIVLVLTESMSVKVLMVQFNEIDDSLTLYEEKSLPLSQSSDGTGLETRSGC